MFGDGAEILCILALPVDLGPVDPVFFPCLRDFGFEDARLALHAGFGTGDARRSAQGLQGRFHVGRHGCRDGDILFFHGMAETQQFSVQGLTVDEIAFLTVDLVPEQWKSFVRELHADLIPTAGFEFHFYDRMAGQALQHAVVGDGLLGSLRVATLVYGHAQGFRMLHQVAGHGAAVFRQFAHQDGFVDTVQFVFLEHSF